MSLISFQNVLNPVFAAAWNRRGRAKELKSRGGIGPIVFELKYREKPNTSIITYHLAIDEGNKGAEVVEEWLDWGYGTRGQPFRFLEFKREEGWAVSGDAPDSDDVCVETLERILKKSGYFSTGLRKLDLARAIAPHLDPARNTSKSFQVFRSAILVALAIQ